MTGGSVRRPRVLMPLAWTVCALSAAAGAEELPADEPLRLRASPMLQESLGDAARQQSPSFLSGDAISRRPDQETVIDGHVELRRSGLVLQADHLSFDEAEGRARASGHVRINREGNVFEGTELDLKVDSFEGFFVAPRYRFLANGAHGEASRVEFIDQDRAVIRDASYTTCERRDEPGWTPDWVLKARRIELDNAEESGQAHGAVLRFKDVPILPIPSMSFPLTERRKSGVLPPTFGVDSVNGLELSLPYYWDIAPNRDATFYPTLMSKRGVDFGTEFRYLEDAYQGQARVNLMPSDKLRERERWGYSASHVAELAPNLGLNLKLNRVSDDNYWRDFTRAGFSLTQRLLPSDGRLAWSEGDFSASVRALKWQTLQDLTNLSAPIVPPYDRMPQIAARYGRINASGFDLSLDADTTRFEADFSRLPLALRPVQSNGQRSVLVGQLSRPWVEPWIFVTPKLRLHTTNYQFDQPLANGATSASRTVPTFSLDSGLVFERDANLFGRGLRQTLEPRVYYVRTPFRDQSQLPNYDSGAHDFNFATVYTDNAFVGHDRIADSNLLTLGLGTRLLDADTGAEAARLGIAQRVRFSDQLVTLRPEDEPVSERLSDVLVGGSINWDPRWSFDSTIQYNPKIRRSIRSTVGGRYSPGNYRVVSAAYRLQRGASEQLDLGWQWPINDLWGDRGQDLGPGRGLGGGRWYSVGRLNYSLQDRKLVDAIVGVEYDGCCWIGRLVLERLQSTSTTASTRIMAQLEFVGFSRLGSNPLKTLRENIPRYQYLREDVTRPSRFSQYD